MKNLKSGLWFFAFMVSFLLLFYTPHEVKAHKKDVHGYSGRGIENPNNLTKLAIEISQIDFHDEDEAELKKGAVDEDKDISKNFRYENHHWNPHTNSPGPAFPTRSPETALNRAIDLWNRTDTAFKETDNRWEGDNKGSIHTLGRVLHVLQDMTAPPHVHAPGGHGWFSYYDPVKKFQNKLPYTGPGGSDLGFYSDFEVAWSPKFKKDGSYGNDYYAGWDFPEVLTSPLTPENAFNAVIPNSKLDDVSEKNLRKKLRDIYLNKDSQSIIERYMRAAAWITYYHTSFYGQITMDINAPAPDSTVGGRENILKTMFPDRIFYNGVLDYWAINGVGYYNKDDEYFQNDWWYAGDLGPSYWVSQEVADSNIWGQFYIYLHRYRVQGADGNEEWFYATPPDYWPDGSPNDRKVQLAQYYGNVLLPLAARFSAGLLREVFPAPSSVSFQRVNNQYDIRWDSIPDTIAGTPDGYKIERSKGGRASWPDSFYIKSGSTYTDDDIDPEKTYQYRVRAEWFEQISRNYSWSKAINEPLYGVAASLTYALNVKSSDPGGGTVTGEGTYEDGHVVIVTATPNIGYSFVNWTDSAGNEVSTEREYTFTAVSEDTLTANFIEVGLPLNVSLTQIDSSNFPEIKIYVSVLDENDKSIEDLNEENFSVFEQGVKQNISVDRLDPEEDHMSVALVLDTSGSMSGQRMRDAKAAALDFIKNSLEPGDRAAVIEFATIVTVVQDFTDDNDALINAVESLTATGWTAIYDAVYISAGKLQEETAVKCVLLFTDGDDNRSGYNVQQAIDRANAIGVPVYTIAFAASSRNIDILKKIAADTNAGFYDAPTGDDLLEIYRSVAERQRTQYVISYTSHIAESLRNMDEVAISNFPIDSMMMASPIQYNSSSDRIMMAAPITNSPRMDRALRQITVEVEHDGERAVSMRSYTPVRYSVTNAGEPIEGPPSVRIIDSDDNPIVGKDVTIREQGGCKFDGGMLTVQTDSDGVAEFSDLLINTAGVYSLAFDVDEDYISDMTKDFIAEIVPANADRMSIVTQPDNMADAGRFIGGPPSVRMLDEFNNPVANVAVTVNLDGDAEFTEESTTTTETGSDGVAVFESLSINEIGSYSLIFDASAVGVMDKGSNTFDITIGQAFQLAFEMHPVSAVADEKISPVIMVRIEDAGGNLVETDNMTQVDLFLYAGEETGDIDLAGTSFRTAKNGIVSFEDISINIPGTYMMGAVADNIQMAFSEPFTVHGYIQNRIDEAIADPDIDIVEIKPGKYVLSEPIRIATGAEGLTLRSTEGSNNTMIDAQCEDTAIIIEADGVKIEGFRIENFHKSGILVFGNNVEIFDNVIDGYCEMEKGKSGTAIEVNAAEGSMIYDNHITDAEIGVAFQGPAAGTSIFSNVISRNEIGITNSNNTELLPTDTKVFQNDIYTNDIGVVWNAANEEQRLNATENWWGNKTGPFHETKNPDGEGDSISENVEFEPWAIGKYFDVTDKKSSSSSSTCFINTLK